MNVRVEPGSYVAAVSGGVDSIVLLDILSRNKNLKLTVAHFDHGMREDSAEDRRFMQELAKKYNLPFVYDEGHLGAGASEAKARTARYAFLRQVKQASGAQAIITAHHQDDVLETAILNMLRGTGRKGLTSLQSHPDTIRPLLGVTKSALLGYAQVQTLKWREDPTNQDEIYLRNYVRHSILPIFSENDRSKLVRLITKMEATNRELDKALENLLNSQSEGTIDRQWFNRLPHAVAKEIMASWLRSNQIRDFNSQTLERLVTAAKTAAAGKRFPVLAGLNLLVYRDHLALTGAER